MTSDSAPRPRPASPPAGSPPVPSKIPRTPPAPVPPPPAAAAVVFGAALDRAVSYVEMLATDGVVRGLLGPREVPRLWDRHLLNCAVVADLVPPRSRLVDVGSGAGFPGIVLALTRPDLDVVLLEPLARRVAFLEECRARLRLDSVTVQRGRAEEPEVIRGLGGADVVTARAVAPLDRLAGWCLPLLRVGGCVLAIKGESAAAELAAARRSLQRAGVTEAKVVEIGSSVVSPATRVVVLNRGTVPARARGGRRR
jgi:16S rRNA (guanine527-N7)-methyltransferase